MSQSPRTSGQKREPRVAEDREPEDAAECRRPPQRAAPLGGDHRDEDDCRRQHLVEDLAVQVDVVPDEVRVKRGEQGAADRNAVRRDASSDRVDDPGGGDRDRDVRHTDRHPRPIDPVDRDEEEAVERLRVGGRDARDEAVRAMLEEDDREVVALVRVGGEDLVALVQERGQSRQPGGDRERDVGVAVQSAQGESGTVRGRLLPR